MHERPEDASKRWRSFVEEAVVFDALSHSQNLRTSAMTLYACQWQKWVCATKLCMLMHAVIDLQLEAAGKLAMKGRCFTATQCDGHGTHRLVASVKATHLIF